MYTHKGHMLGGSMKGHKVHKLGCETRAQKVHKGVGRLVLRLVFGDL